MIVLVVSHVLYLVFVRVESYDVISSLSPKNCNDSSYFDSLSHKCKSCGIFQTASRDRLSCKCDVGRYPGYSEKTKSIECVSCVQSFQSDTCLKDNINCELYDIKGRNHSFIFYLSFFLLFFSFYFLKFFLLCFLRWSRMVKLLFFSLASYWKYYHCKMSQMSAMAPA